MYDIFENCITKIKQKHMPCISVKFKKHKHKLSNWISYGILHSIKFRDRLYKQLKSTQVDTPEYLSLKINLQNYNKVLKQSIRAAKQAHYYDIFNEHRNNIQKTWTSIKNVLNQGKGNDKFPSVFLIENKMCSDKDLIANKFNEYFTQIGPRLAGNIDIANKRSYESYLGNPCEVEFNFTRTTSEEVVEIISKMKPKSSSGLDSISCRLMKDISDIIAIPLTSLINQSRQFGIFPDKLKIAKVVPIFKAGKDNIDSYVHNYRPISLLSCFSKIFERVVYNQLYNHLQLNKLLYESQYGFRKSHSTELAALELIDSIYRNLDQGKTPIAIFLDLSKAFDTIDHKILINKLHHCGCRNTSLNWFKSYLTERSQYVIINDTMSKTLQITTGVPQGSVLGPLLFLIYINDLSRATDKFKYILFADDTNLISNTCSFKNNSSQNNIDQISLNINVELGKISDWMSANKLSLNTSKSKFIIFSYRQKKMEKIKTPILKINGSRIERKREANFLGLFINEHMNWNTHIFNITKNITKTLGVMNRLKHYLPQSVLQILYNSLILSHLNSNITAWGFAAHKLCRLQKRALRLITDSKYNAHTEPLLKVLGTLTLDDIFKTQCLKFYFKFSHGNLPPFFDTFFTETNTHHNYQTRHRNDIHFQTTHSATAQNCIRYYIPKLLSTLPTRVTEKIHTHCYTGFCKYVKKYFVDQYNDSCSIKHCYICSN